MEHDEVASKLHDIACEIIDHPERWCQRKFAQDAGRREVLAADPKAVQWCALGFIYRSFRTEQIVAVGRLAKAVGVYVPHWNDSPGTTALRTAAAFLVAASLDS